MSVMEWKNLNFFCLTPSLDGTDTKLSFVKADITSYCCNTDFCVFCDEKGYIHVLKNNCGRITTFRIQSKAIQKCAISKRNGLLVVLMQSEEESEAILQVYDIFKIEMSSGGFGIQPTCISSCKLSIRSSNCCLQILLKDEILMIAIGCEKSGLIFHRGPVRNANLNFRCFSYSSPSIRGIEFGNGDRMFVCTEDEIYCYTPVENLFVDKKIVLDARNSNFDCCSALQTSNTKDPYFLVGRKNAVYCFTADGRGPCYAIEGKKKCIVWYKDYLAMLIAKETDASTLTTLVIIDIKNKLVTLQKKIQKGCGLLTDGANCYILTTENELFLIEEYSLKKKLQLLLKKNLYDIALQFIETQTCDEDIIADVYIKFGDYLLSKNKTELALQNYIKTIGYIDSYSIIQNLLSSRENDCLFEYLRKLAEQGYAKDIHVQLLLKCNERQNISNLVDTYLKDEKIFSLPQYSLVKTGKTESNKVLFDFSFSSYLKIIDDQKQLLEFISCMPKENIYKFVSENAKFLLDQYPHQTMNVLNEICRSTSDSLLINAPLDLTPFLLGHEIICKKFLENYMKSSMDLKKSLHNILFELYLRGWCQDKVAHENVQEFLNEQSNSICELHMLLLCKSHQFCPTSNFFCNNSYRSKFYQQFFFQNTLSKFRNSMQKTELKFDNLFKFNNYDLEQILSTNKTILEITQNVSKNEKMFLNIVKKTFDPSKSQKANYKLIVDDTRKHLLNKSNIMDALIKFLTRPVEFRSNSCSICRQEICLPAVYFLCKHVFHKECLSLRSRKEVCVICAISEPEFAINETSEKQFSGQSIECCFSNVTKQISDTLANGLVRYPFIRSYFKTGIGFYSRATISQINTRRSHLSTNPFEEENDTESYEQNLSEEYDANLNPFEANNTIGFY